MKRGLLTYIEGCFPNDDCGLFWASSVAKQTTTNCKSIGSCRSCGLPLVHSFYHLHRYCRFMAAGEAGVVDISLSWSFAGG
jgi:hypothetical protein